jgi:hypothetical protein
MINVLKTNIIPLTRKTNSIHFIYSDCDLLNLRTDYASDLGITLDT